MTTTPSRRWLRFSLRTLFVVVTLFCVWLGWSRMVIERRQQTLARLEDDGCKIIRCDPFFPFAALPAKGGSIRMVRPPALPAVRRWLGDEPIVAIYLVYPRTEVDRLKIESQFPEADVRLPHAWR